MEDYADVLREAVSALATHGAEAARVALEPIARLTWLERYALRRPTRPIAPQSLDGGGKRSFSIARSAATFVHDGFRCWHCSRRVVSRSIAVLLHDVYPSGVPYNVHYKHGFIHPLFWTNVAEADHLKPGSSGGSWDDPSNHVTACSLCNAKKSNAEPERLTAHTGKSEAWDGLLSLYRDAWIRADRPRRRYHEAWIRAFEKAAGEQGFPPAT